MDFDELLTHIGEFGLYQRILFLFQAPFCVFLTFIYFSQLFITLTPDHWCKVNELQGTSLSLLERRNFSIPIVGDGFSQCTMYDVNFTRILSEGAVPNSTWPITNCRNGWEYDFSEIPYQTISSENNWVCDEGTKPTIAQSVFFLGAILGGFLFGYIADNYGRLPGLLACNLLGCLAGVFASFSGNFYVFIAFRFVAGMAFDNAFVMIYILVLEYVGPKYRTLVANLSIALFYTAGTLFVPWMAYYIRDWRMFSLATSAPMIITIGAYWVVPESARWLISKGQTDRAMHILKKFEKVNGTKVDDSVYNKFLTHVEAERKEIEEDKKYTFIDLLRTPHLRRVTIVLTLVWLIIAVVYDGHARNVGNLGLDIFITFTIASATEMPADIFLVFTLDVWGRRWLAVGTLILSGLFSFASIAVPMEFNILAATMAILGRFCVNIAFNIGLQYAAELLPTVIRAQGVTTIHIVGYVGSILSPFIVYLAIYGRGVPLAVLGGLSIIGGILCVALPETLGANLPNTLEEGETFAREQNVFDFSCVARSKDSEVPEDLPEGSFRRRPNSLRASVRGEVLRSSLVGRKRNVPSVINGNIKPTSLYNGSANNGAIRTSTEEYVL